MNNKRNTLKKIAGVSAVASVLPSAWVKPVVSSVVLPAHAQTSVNQPPTISGISCAFDTDSLQVGTVITMNAVFADVDSTIADFDWAVKKNDAIHVTGTGQFTTTTYTVLAEDVGALKFELEVFDDSGNRVIETLCDGEVATTLCTESVLIDTSFDSLGFVFGIEEGCRVGIGSENVVVTTYNLVPNRAIVVYDFSDGRNTFVDLTINISKVRDVTVVDITNRRWEGELTLTYDGSKVTVTGTLNLQ